MMKISRKAQTRLILIFLMLVSFVCVSLAPFLKMKVEVFFPLLLGYVIMMFFLDWLAKKIKINLLNRIVYVLAFPVSVIFLIMKLSLPTGGLIFNALMLLMLTFGIPFFVIHGIDGFFELKLSYSTILFCSLSTAAIMSVYLSKYILKIVLDHSPIMMDTYAEKSINIYMKELTIIIFQQKNIIFLIYFCYFVYLSITSFYKIQYQESFFNIETDLAVMQSFVVFLAFSNMVSRSQDVSLAENTILSLYTKIIWGEDKTE